MRKLLDYLRIQEKLKEPLLEVEFSHEAPGEHIVFKRADDTWSDDRGQP